MYKLVVVKDGIEKVHEFATAELARLYRDYHLAFGNWNGLSRWVDEKDITQEQQSFIIDEMTEIRAGVVVRVYKITDGIELSLELASPETVPQVWQWFREKRNLVLKQTDWTQLSDCEMPTELRKDYRGYRSYLRVLPSLHNDDTILTAKIYSFEEWKKGSR
jgi:hypothetical protein